jgi:hypothetical protein
LRQTAADKVDAMTEMLLHMCHTMKSVVPSTNGSVARRSATSRR